MIEYIPRPYQDTAINWTHDKQKFALFLDVGLGKSSVALTKIADTILLGEVKHWLIIAPKRVCQTTWPQEFEKWSFTAGLRVKNLCGLMGAEREKHAAIAACEADVTIINIDNLAKLIRQFPTWPWDGVVIDESSKMKDSSTQRWKLFSHVSRKLNHLILLTGSPCAQSLMNLWAQVYLLDDGERLGRHVSAFKHRYFKQVDWHGYEWEPHDWALEAIMDKISDLCLTMQAKDHLDLTEPQLNKLDVMLDLKTLNKYRQLEKEYFLETQDDDAPITAPTASVLSGKLSQLANGNVYYEDEESVRQVEQFHDYKLKALQDFAEEHGDRFILSYHFKSDKHRIAEMFKDNLQFFDGSNEQLREWEEGVFQILALHPQSGGHGVDGLQHYTNTVVWYAPPWSREQFDQVNGRVMGARQIGTEFEGITPYSHLLVAKGTIDDTALEILEERGGTQEGFLSGMKARAQQYLT